MLRNILLVLCLTPMVFGCVTKSKYVMLETDLQQTQADLDDMARHSQMLEAKLNDAKISFEELKKSKEELEEKSETYSKLVDSLQTEIEAGQIKISQMKDRLTVNMVDKILFDSGKTEVKDTGKETLDKVAAILKEIQDKQILVNGHTDNIPIGAGLKKRFPSNWELSTARATSVVRYLADNSVPPELMVAAGHGMYDPVASNETEDGRTENRRIEIVLVPKPVSNLK